MNQLYYERALKLIQRVPRFMDVDGPTQASPMEQVQKIAEVAMKGGNLKPFEDFYDEWEANGYE